jgi:hypothetical protein
MLLDPHEADLFFRLQRTLMFFVNQFQEEALRKGLIPYVPARPQPSSYDDEDE